MKIKQTIPHFFTSGVTFFFSVLSHASSPLVTVPYVDLKRYMGDWNVIANIPNFIEKNCISSVESYSLRPDGKIDNTFVCRKANGNELRLSSLIWVHNPNTQAEWRVRFNWDSFFGQIPIPIHFSYWVIDLDSEFYRYTVVGHPSRKLLWIMSRDHFIDETTYEQILLRVKNQGYDPAQIVKLPQLPEVKI